MDLKIKRQSPNFAFDSLIQAKELDSGIQLLSSEVSSQVNRFKRAQARTRSDSSRQIANIACNFDEIQFRQNRFSGRSASIA